MNLKTQSEILDELHHEFLKLVGDGKVLEKKFMFRFSPHDPSLLISELKPTDDFRNITKNYKYNRQLLASINQLLR